MSATLLLMDYKSVILQNLFDSVVELLLVLNKIDQLVIFTLILFPSIGVVDLLLKNIVTEVLLSGQLVAFLVDTKVYILLFLFPLFISLYLIYVILI